MLEKFIDNDVMGFERVLRDVEKNLLLKGTHGISYKGGQLENNYQKTSSTTNWSTVNNEINV